MKASLVGLLVGMALGFAAWLGFGAFLLVASLGAIGFGVGRMVERGTDWRDLLGGADERRRR